MATNLTVLVTFTQNSGAPATGLALADIDIYLTSINKSTGVVAVVWGPQNPTVELTNIGAYARILATADLNTFDYVALGQYTGATALDNDYVSGAASQVEANTMQVESLDATDQIRDSILSDATTFAGANIDAAITTRATPVQVNTEVVDALSIDTYVEPAAVPAATASLATKLGWLFVLARNKIIQTSALQTLRNDADAADIGTATVSDVAGIATRDEWT